MITPLAHHHYSPDQSSDEKEKITDTRNTSNYRTKHTTILTHNHLIFCNHLRKSSDILNYNSSHCSTSSERHNSSDTIRQNLCFKIYKILITLSTKALHEKISISFSLFVRMPMKHHVCTDERNERGHYTNKHRCA